MKHFRGTPRTADLVALSLLAGAVLLVFGSRSAALGFYADDTGFMTQLPPGITLTALLDAMRGYVTGRNLHMLWQYLIFLMAGGSTVDQLPALHAIQAFFDALNVVLVYGLLRSWPVSVFTSLTAAALFAFFRKPSGNAFLALGVADEHPQHDLGPGPRNWRLAHSAVCAKR